LARRLVVVSNRIAAVREGETAAGGLAVAVLSALRDHGGVWFGWSGEFSSTPSTEATVEQRGEFSVATIDITRRDHNEYYGGFSNSVLWPLFHYRPDLVAYSRRDFAGYMRVNQQFAQALIPLLRPDDVIWVHDYHLIPLGQELRRAGVRNPLGFFLHTPVPARQLMLTLPAHEAIMRSLSAYDLVGFQTKGDLTSYFDYMREEAGAEITDETYVRAYGRLWKAGVYPIGIDAGEVMDLSAEHADSPETERLRRMLRGRGLMLGVDRLDYSKGLVERFRAFERLLEHYPSERRRVTLMQVAPPSRTSIGGYREIRRALELSASSINGRFSDFDWVPIRYLNKGFSRSELACFYRGARVGLVTPLRDGMNLVAKEFVAAQNPEDPGVLVLSRFAGAACELKTALIVNPMDVDEVADAMRRALAMPLIERRERWARMIEVIRRQDVHAWRRAFLSELTRTLAAAEAA